VRFVEVSCPPGYDDRLDRALADLVTGLSRTQARRLIADGGVFVDGRRCRVASRIVRGGSRLRVATLPPRASEARLQILYEDEACVAVDKPADMPAAPTRSAAAGTVFDVLQRQLRERDRRPRALWLVHRLDAPTSGVLLFAKSREAAAALGRAFERQLVTKAYVARVAGHPSQPAGSVDLPLRNIGGRSAVRTDGRPAHTEWEVVSSDSHTSLVRLRPKTGRMHQLRVHMQALGHPIVGDRLYGGPVAPRLMLHAATLIVPHPSTGQPIEIHAPVPPELGAGIFSGPARDQ